MILCTIITTDNQNLKAMYLVRLSLRLKGKKE